MLLLSMDIFDRIFAHFIQLYHVYCQVFHAVPGLHVLIKNATLASTHLFILFLIFVTDAFVITFNRFKGTVWDTLFEQCWYGSEKAIATLDMCIKEGEWFAGFDG